MAAVQALRLSPGQALRALDDIDLPRLAAERLLAAGGPAGPVVLSEPGAGWPPALTAEPEVAVEDPGTGAMALLPAPTLRAVWSAGLAALACRLLAAPGVLTAAVFGSGPGLDWQVGVLARCLPALSHVTVPRALASAPGGRDALAELDLAGIGLATRPDSRRAALGANLIVLAASAGEVPDLGPPAPGTLLVSAAGRDLPAVVLDRVDRVYVDDPGLLARPAPDDSRLEGDESAPLLRPREGWYRHHEAGQHGRRGPGGEVALRDVLAGTAPGRTGDEEILLAELLGGAVLDAGLAWRLWQSALAHGLGDRVERKGSER